MIQEFVKAWDEHKDEVERVFRGAHPDNYLEIVEPVILTLIISTS